MAEKKRGNVKALVKHVGSVGFGQCVREVTGKVGNPRAVCGKLKGMAKKAGVLSKAHAFGRRKK